MSDPRHAGGVPAGRFDELLQSSQAALYAFTRHLLGESEDARDVVQDVYVLAWRAVTLRQPGPPPHAAWMRKARRITPS